jgi:uncharacterized membrane protein YccC
MVYDPVGFINTSIAAVVAAATALVLWAIIAPATPQAAGRHFVRAAPGVGKDCGGAASAHRARRVRYLTMTEALGQLRSQLRSDQPDDIAAYEAGIALFGLGHELIRVRDDGAASAAALELDIAKLAGNQRAQWLDRARRTAEEAAAKCLTELRADVVGTKEAEAAARKIVAFAAIRDELERGGPLLSGETHEGTQSDAA